MLESISPLETPGKAAGMTSCQQTARRLLPGAGSQAVSQHPGQAAPTAWARDRVTAPAPLLGPLLHRCSSPAAQGTAPTASSVASPSAKVKPLSAALIYSDLWKANRFVQNQQAWIKHVCTPLSKCPVNSSYYLAR